MTSILYLYRQFYYPGKKKKEFCTPQQEVTYEAIVEGWKGISESLLQRVWLGTVVLSLSVSARKTTPKRFVALPWRKNISFLCKSNQSVYLCTCHAVHDWSRCKLRFNASASSSVHSFWPHVRGPNNRLAMVILS